MTFVCCDQLYKSCISVLDLYLYYITYVIMYFKSRLEPINLIIFEIENSTHMKKIFYYYNSHLYNTFSKNLTQIF